MTLSFLCYLCFYWPFPRLSREDLTTMPKSQWALVQSHSTVPIRKHMWPVMKIQSRQTEVWLSAYRMSEKWVTRVGGLILVSELKKTEGIMLIRVHTVTWLPRCRWDSTGARNLWWLCLIRFSLGCIQHRVGRGGWALQTKWTFITVANHTRRD